MDLSIVSGTFNRISYLQSMVNSVRQSISDLYGFRYEFVLVDGGSNDGTQDWCKQQSDIRLIQHRGLLGAVKAFNDGAYAATGKYVIMANDDIEFIDNSVLLAYIYMENNPDCGGGCFYQDRDGREWHVNGMPAVSLNRKQIHVPYAQVGIFPKWLGDYVGWWCRDEDFENNLTSDDYRMIGDGLIGLHTYGGDNELSAKIIDLGYQISPIPGAKITDKEADDSLRTTNNINGGSDPKSVKGHHPDSWKWGKRWFRRNQKIGYRDLAGPIIKDRIMARNPMAELEQSRERVLYLPLFEPGWQVLREQKRGLRDALAKVAVVYEYDYMNCRKSKFDMMVELTEICQQFKPTIVLTQLHNPDQINAKGIGELRGACLPLAKFVNWNGDYWPDQLLDTRGIELARSFDLMTTVNRDVVEKHQAMGINTQYWQIGWEPEGRGHNHPLWKYDVVFLASGYSEKRQRLGQRLFNQSFGFGLFGHGWPDNMAIGENLYNFQEACQVYRGSKIAIGDSQWPESGFVSNRIFQILAAGNCTLCHQWFRDYEQLGLIDNVNCIIWQNLDDLEDKLNYWLSDSNSQKLSQISLEGEKLVLERHSFEARVDELWRMLEIGVEMEAGWRW